MAKAFEFLSKRNRTLALTRIENAPESLAARCREKGYRVVPKGPDFVYRRAGLAALRGDRYKSQRVGSNHCVAPAKPPHPPLPPGPAGGCPAFLPPWPPGAKSNRGSA